MPERGWQIAVWTLCAVGVALRIAAYAQGWSLWYDEAALALNIRERGFIQLVTPLDHLQTAPLLFLWAERAMVLAFGANEWSLRAIPLLAGIATPPVMWRVAKRILPPPAAVLAVALVAVAPGLVRYSAELKPYATDALMTLVVMHHAVLASRDTATGRAWWRLALVGCLAIVASTPAVFVLAGVVAFMALGALIARDARWIKRAAGLALVWAATFLTLVATIFRPLLDQNTEIGRFMQWFWAESFLTNDPPGIVAKAITFVWVALPSVFVGDTAFRGGTTMMLAVAICGCIALAVTRRAPELLLLTVPIAAMAGASMLRRYPIASRLVLFAAPLFALMLAASLLALGHPRLRSVQRSFAAALTAVVTLVAVRSTIVRIQSDDGREESRALVREAMRQRASGLPVWVSRGGQVAWRFYSHDSSTFSESGPDDLTTWAGFAIARDVIVGAWYDRLPERISRAPGAPAAVGRPSPWGAQQAARLRALAHPCGLVFLSHARPGEPNALVTSAEQLGGRVVERRRAPGAELYRVCFES